MIPTREWAQTQTTTKNKLEFYKNSMKLVDLSFIIYCKYLLRSKIR